MVARARTVQTPNPESTPALNLDKLDLPAEIQGVAEAVANSRALLSLQDDWDGEGTRGFTEQTWRRTANFLIKCALQLWEDHGVAADHVEILPGSDGALAIDWRTAGRELLVTFPRDPARSALFYGDDGKGDHTIKGTLDTSAPNRWLTAWLAE
jgi:hypothetical protein